MTFPPNPASLKQGYPRVARSTPLKVRRALNRLAAASAPPDFIGDGGSTALAVHMPVQYSVAGNAGSPSQTITITWTSENANTFLAAPNGAPGVPTFRAIVLADLPTINVAGGGTGLTSLTPYAVVCGGTTTTGNVQQVSGLGTSGQVLTSNGAGALPTWQTPSGGMGTVTSVAAAGPAGIASWSAAITTSGTLTQTLLSQTKNEALMSPDGANGVPTFRAIVLGDLPTIDVPHGGTGDTSIAAYCVVCGGTSNTGALQTVSGTGTANQLLASNGAGALPSWKSLSTLGTFTVIAGNGLSGGGTAPIGGSLTLNAVNPLKAFSVFSFVGAPGGVLPMIINHNLNTTSIIVAVYSNNTTQFTPVFPISGNITQVEIVIVDANNISLDFANAILGLSIFIVIMGF